MLLYYRSTGVTPTLDSEYQVLEYLMHFSPSTAAVLDNSAFDIYRTNLATYFDGSTGLVFVL